jgi:hypothetical protein
MLIAPEILDRAVEARAKGHEWFQLYVRRRSVPKNWDRCQVAPRIYGRVIGESGSVKAVCGRYRVFLVDVRVDDIPADVMSAAEKRSNG